MELYKFQIASLLIMIIIIIDFLGRKKLPLIRNRLFCAFIFVSFLNIIFDILTVYTIYHIDTVPSVINRLVHQLFIGSMLVLIFILYIYIYLLTSYNRKPNKYVLLLYSIPFIIDIFIVIFGKLKYHIGDDGRYSYGMMAETIYISVAFYEILILIRLFILKNTLSLNRKIQIALGQIIWMAIAIIQGFNPTILMSSIAVSLMNLFVYISFENPSEYSDSEINALNSKAFYTIANEYFSRNKEFWVISCNLITSKLPSSKLSYIERMNSLRQLNHEIDPFNKMKIFHFRSNILYIMGTDIEELNVLDKRIKEIDKKYSYISFFKIFCPKYADNYEELYSLMHYLSKTNVIDSFVNFNDDSFFEEFQKTKKITQLVIDAIHNDGFEVYYQPIYSLSHKKFISAEALVRLKDTKTVGFVSPEVFVPIAEENGLICDLGRIVFEKVCEFYTKNKLKELGISFIEVNLSRMQIEDPNLIDTLKSIINKYSIDSSVLNLEITETASTKTTEILLNNIDKLKKLGCQFSMDDFGTGYSNLSQVNKMNYRLIKLDKSLIWPCFGENSNESSKVILETIIRMANKLDLEIVAEGVETKEMTEFLLNNGVEYLQGYYYSKPIDSQKFLAYINQYNK